MGVQTVWQTCPEVDVRPRRRRSNEIFTGAIANLKWLKWQLRMADLVNFQLRSMLLMRTRCDQRICYKIAQRLKN